MWNFLPRVEPAFSLLYGKRPFQRVIVGTRGQQIEIPISVVDELKRDSSVTYVGNKYVSMPWEDFIKIKTDANNLIHSNVKSAITQTQWFHKLKDIVQGKSAETEADLLQSIKIATPKYPTAD
jgi:hypothetical protein